MIIKKDENKIVGHWQFDGRNAVRDDECKRIEWLITNYLQKITSDQSGWNILYRDPNDHRFWELTYPQSEMHGGGPPVLTNITYEAAKLKYSVE